tara:strand:- start:272 stop:442 length:171 start_codon:yes stop_codon:yes gene_type:complete
MNLGSIYSKTTLLLVESDEKGNNNGRMYHSSAHPEGDTQNEQHVFVLLVSHVLLEV